MYTICVNRPGYLPDSESNVYEVETLEDAVESLREELRQTHNAIGDQEDERTLAAVLEEASTCGSNGMSIEFHGYAHEIGLTDHEQEARDLAKLDCQIWDNLPAGAQNRYRHEARDREEDTNSAD